MAELAVRSWLAVPMMSASDLSGLSCSPFCRYHCLTSAVHADRRMYCEKTWRDGAVLFIFSVNYVNKHLIIIIIIIISPTRRTAMRVHCEKTSLYTTFWLIMDVFARKCSHRSTCLHTTCHTISYVVLARHFPRSVPTTRRIHARVHTLKDGCLCTFWLTKSCLGPCVTLNISHLVCHIISHRCSRNKVQRHNFLTYEPFSLCNFWLTRTSPCANCHIRGRVCVQFTK